MFASLDLTHGVVPALAAGILIAIAATFLVGRRSRYVDRAAVRTLCVMGARELMPLILLMLKRRGFELPAGTRTPGETTPNFTVARGKSRYLVQTRFETEGEVDAATIERFATAIAQENADGGFLIATCTVLPQARASISGTKLELIGADQLWREMQPILPEQISADIRAAGHTARMRRLQIGALASVAAAAAIYGLTTWPAPNHEAAPVAVERTPASPAAAATDTTEPPVQSPPPAAPPSAVTRSAAPAAVATTPPPAAVAAQAPPSPPASAAELDALGELDENQLAARREQAARTARGLKDVESAEWSAKSTLVVAIKSTEGDDRRRVAGDVCSVIVQYEELRYTRLQVQDLSGGNNVTWRQCQ